MRTGANLRAAKANGNKIKKSKPEDKSLNHPMTDKQRLFVRKLVDGQMTVIGATKAAGYKDVDQGYDLLKQPKIKAAVAAAREKYAIASGMTRQKVIDGFVEAIDMARIKADPLTMVSGWREIGKMCGFYEPTKTKLEISVRGKVMLEKMSALSDEELLQLAHEHEGEFEVIDEPDAA